MADDWFDGRPYLDTLTAPSIVVMPSEPWPAEFYSRYPNAIRVPVRIVWREAASARDDGPAARLARPVATAQSGATPRAPAKEPPAESPSRAAPAPFADAGPGQGQPVGTFLRVNGFLDRLMGQSGPGTADAQANDGGKPQDPNTPVPFFDDRGRPVLDPTGHQICEPSA